MSIGLSESAVKREKTYRTFGDGLLRLIEHEEHRRFPDTMTKKRGFDQERLKRAVYGEEVYKEEELFEKQVERNLIGIELEKAGKLDEAIKLYEKNINEDFEGNHPYDRLAIIYRKRGQLGEEIRVLEKAIWVFENLLNEARSDRESKLCNFNDRLEKAKRLRFNKIK